MKPQRIRKPRLAVAPKSGWRQASGKQAYRYGHGAEWMAAAWLIAKGYQLLGFRLKVRGVEIDILARRGRTLAIVEVKRRATIEAALAAIGPQQLERLRTAGATVLRQRPGLSGLVMRIDTVALAPGRFPRHRRGL